jgi:YVTN family beta-propeller protein
MARLPMWLTSGRPRFQRLTPRPLGPEPAIPVVYAFPQRIAVSPDGASAYVTYAGAISVIDTNTKTLRATVSLPVEGMSTGIAVTPDGRAVYVTSVPPIPFPDHQGPRPTPEPGAVSVHRCADECRRRDCGAGSAQ